MTDARFTRRVLYRVYVIRVNNNKIYALEKFIGGHAKTKFHDTYIIHIYIELVRQRRYLHRVRLPCATQTNHYSHARLHYITSLEERKETGDKSSRNETKKTIRIEF